MRLKKKNCRFISMLLSVLLLFSNIFGGTLGVLAMERDEALSESQQPHINMDGNDFFTPGSDYHLTVTSDMDGLLTITLEGHETIIADSEPIQAGEAFEIRIENMPQQEHANFIITVRPRNDDFENLSVPAFQVFNVNAVEFLDEANVQEESSIDEIITVEEEEDEQEQQNQEKQITEVTSSSYELAGHQWKLKLFGDGVREDSVSYDVAKDSVSLTVRDNRGRISSSTDGIYFFYLPLEDIETDFILTATMSGTVVDANNQAAAGLMVRGDLDGFDNPSMVALGASDHRYIYTRNEGANLLRTQILTGQQGPIEDVEVMLQRIGDSYTIAYDGVIQDGINATDIQFRDGKMYVGLFVARNATATFSQINFETLDDTNLPTSLEVSGPNKKVYLENEDIDLEGLEVIAHYPNQTKRILSESEFHITGLDSSKLGDHQAIIHYRGLSTTFEYSVVSDDIVSIEVVSPIKIEYAIDQPFNPLGIRVLGQRMSSESVYLNEDEFTYEVPAFDQPGEVEIKVTYKGDERIQDTFTVNVVDRTIEELVVYRQPNRTEFIVGQQAPETVERAILGSVVQARFSDGHREVITLHDETGFTIEYDPSFTQHVGNHNFKVSYMGLSTEIPFTVIDKEAIGLAIVDFPQTTYFIGDELDLEGLNLAIVYNDGSLSDLLEKQDYRLDITSFNSEKIGVNVFPIIGISEKTLDLEGELRVTVREIEDFASGWNHIVYGQSATLDGNKIEVTGEFGTIGPDTTIELNTVDGRGKIADGHDGINYYYRALNIEDNFILSADIDVISVGTLDQSISLANQVGFGLMLADRIGVHGDSSVWHSSMALVGSRVQQNQAFWSAWTRDNRPLEEGGITPQNHRIGSQVNGELHGRVIGPDFRQPSQIIPRLFEADNPSSNAHVVLERANNQIIAEITMGGETTRYELDHDIPFDMYDKDHIYVGFFTARDAHIKVSNANLRVTSSETDAPGPIIENSLVDPSFKIRSLDYSATEDYELFFSANANGVIEIFQNSQLIDTVEVKANRVARYWTHLDQGRNFILRYTPDPSLDHLSHYNQQVEHISVTHLSTEGDIYVSPNGNGVGTAIDPMSFTRAIRELQPGHAIILTEGVYPKLIIPQWNNGREEARKKIVSQGDVVIQGARLDGDFWHLYDLRFDNGTVRVGGNHNIVELVTISNAPNTGLQISRSTAADKEIHFDIPSWPSHNLILNSEVYNSMDPARTDADGFAAKLTVGEGNRFIGCVSHHNIDDGWDLYAKSVPIGEVLIENSIAYSNGRLIGWTDMGPTHMGTGFKLGGEGVPVAHTIRDSIAFHNGSHGYSSNSNPMLVADNNVSFDNRLRNISLTSYTNIEARDYEVNNFFSYRLDTETWGNERDVIETGSFGEGYDTGESIYLFNGVESVNSLGRKVVEDFFESIEVPEDLGAGSFQRQVGREAGQENISLSNRFLELTKYSYQHTIEEARKALHDLITTVKGKELQQPYFEEMIWVQYEVALKQASHVLENSRLTYEIESAHSLLEKAFLALESGVLPIENTELEEMLQRLQKLIIEVTGLIEREELVESDYTKSTWSDLIDALEQANLAMNSEDIKIVEIAFERLTVSLNSLEKISVEGPTVVLDDEENEEGKEDNEAKDNNYIRSDEGCETEEEKSKGHEGYDEDNNEGDNNDKNIHEYLPNAGQDTLNILVVGIVLIGIVGMVNYAKFRKE